MKSLRKSDVTPEIKQMVLLCLFNTGGPKKLYLTLRVNFGAVHFSVTKMLVFPDSGDMYKSFGTISARFHALIN